MASHNGENGNGSVIPAAIILGLSSLLSKVIGVVRESILSGTYGAGDVTDAFFAAFRIPDMIFNLIVVGALTAAFIPLFTSHLVKGKGGKKKAFDFASSLLNLLVLIVGIFSLIYAIFAPQIVPLITPGFHDAKLAMTITLSRVMALQPILLAGSFVMSGVLNSYKRFIAYALAPLLYNLGIIIGIIYFAPRMGIAGLGWGVVLGAAMHVAIQFPSFIRTGFVWRPILFSSWEDFRAIWRMILPRMFALGVQQINAMVVTILGSGLLSGSISAFKWANDLQYLPIGIFGLSFAQAAFPTLSEQAALGHSSALRKTLARTFRYVLFFVVPVSLFFYLLRAQIVRVLYGHGQFSWEDTIMTFETFGILLISVFAQATIPLLTRAFYARHDTRVPVIISVCTIALNILLAWWLAPLYGVRGLAIAISTSAILEMLSLLSVLHWQLRGFEDKQVLLSLVRISVASIVGGVVLQLLKYPVALLVDMQVTWGVATQVIVTFAGGISTYLLLCWLLKSPELVAVKRYIPRKFKPVAGVETSRFGGGVE